MTSPSAGEGERALSTSAPANAATRPAKHPAESWENEYDGFDSPYGTTRLVLDAARKILPAAKPGPSCRSVGHSWVPIPNPISSETALFGCKECAKRGLVVLRSEVAA